MSKKTPEDRIISAVLRWDDSKESDCPEDLDVLRHHVRCELCRGDADIAALTAERDALKVDAERYRLLRRGQHWSVIDGIGEALRAEALDAAINAAIAKEADK